MKDLKDYVNEHQKFLGNVLCCGTPQTHSKCFQSIFFQHHVAFIKLIFEQRKEGWGTKENKKRTRKKDKQMRKRWYVPGQREFSFKERLTQI